MTKKRLDQWLLDKGYFETRSKAHAAILSGQIFIGDSCEHKPGQYFAEEQLQEINIHERDRYVSRGGHKLEKAIKEFCIDVQNKICMDIGCSSGGFTDCLLQWGAQKVYAIDVGYGQFNYRLRHDPRVILLEKQNIRYLPATSIQDKIDIIVIDVSFISVTKFLTDITKFCSEDFNIIILIKPQFESEKGEVKKGVVSSKDQHIKIVLKLINFFKIHGMAVKNFTISPIKGPKGNIEFLVHLKDHGESINEEKIISIIKVDYDKK